MSWEVPAALDGERVDRAVALLTGLSRASVSSAVDAGHVRLGGRAVRARGRRVHTGEQLEVDDEALDVGDDGPAPDSGVPVAVVHEDAHVLVVDKPAGLVVHPGAGHRDGTLVNGLLARYPDLAGLGGTGSRPSDRPGIVHRLDQGTSGLLVVARTEAARCSLVRQLTARSVERRYTTLVWGAVEADEGLVDGPLGRSDADPTRVAIHAGGRPARTRYRVVRRFHAADGREVSLLECRLETGRTHQIRVHLASIGHPLVGDDRYGLARAATTSGGPALPPGRVFLHAGFLGFDHPGSHERVTFTSPLPPDLAAAVPQ